MDLIERLKWALKEDLPQGDITTDQLGLTDYKGLAYLVAKEDLVLSATEVFHQVCQLVDEDLKLHWSFPSSHFVLKDQIIATIEGNMLSLLKAERTGLNLLGKMSGIATLTKCFVKEVEHTKCKILDTRKTTPLWRDLEKQAVKDGGGHNHRKNLSDQIMLKENHLRISGGIEAAVKKLREQTEGFIEVEVTNLEEVKTASSLPIQRIMLDNMSNELMAEALTFIPNHIEVEASGNMSLKRVKSVAEVGVDFISVGALTHSAPCADISLQFEWSES